MKIIQRIGFNIRQTYFYMYLCILFKFLFDILHEGLLYYLMNINAIFKRFTEFKMHEPTGFGHSTVTQEGVTVIWIAVLVFTDILVKNLQLISEFVNRYLDWQLIISK